MTGKTIKQRLQDGERVVVFAIGRVFHHNMIPMYAQSGGYSGFWIDCEHADFSTKELEVASAMGRAVGLDCFARIPPTDYALVTRCLESGCSGVMAAMISTPEEAERFVRWSKFKPRGERGLNAGAYDGRYGLSPLDEFCRTANERSFVAIQIETIAAVECCDAIAAIEGVDVLFVGPADLSQAYGVPGQIMGPHSVEAVRKVAAACKKHGKALGAVTPTPEHAQLLTDLGCQLVSPTNDIRTMNLGLQAVRERFPKLFG